MARMNAKQLIFRTLVIGGIAYSGYLFLNKEERAYDDQQAQYLEEIGYSGWLLGDSCNRDTEFCGRSVGHIAPVIVPLDSRADGTPMHNCFMTGTNESAHENPLMLKAINSKGEEVGTYRWNGIPRGTKATEAHFFAPKSNKNGRLMVYTIRKPVSVLEKFVVKDGDDLCNNDHIEAVWNRTFIKKPHR